MLDFDRLIAERARSIDASGIRRVFDLGAKLADPINLSIGQPDFPVPEPIKRAALQAIEDDRNGYTVTQGLPVLRETVAKRLSDELGWSLDLGAKPTGDPRLIITSGTSGSLLLASMALLNPGDEMIIPDPYFPMYPQLARLTGATPVLCDTYPDFRLTAERVEPLITDRTKFVLLNSPGNPHGVVATGKDCRELLELCRDKGVLLISDEIYDEFCFDDAREPTDGPFGPMLPSPAREAGSAEDVLLIRGFGKTYACTGWRLGYAAGPARIIEEMAKLQQYTFVCAPAPLQLGVAEAFGCDMDPHVAEYKGRRDLVLDRLGQATDIAKPGGAFYAFPQVPDHLGISAQEFVERCIERSVLVIPGGVFSTRDTHFRISYATDRRSLERGLDALAELMSA